MGKTKTQSAVQAMNLSDVQTALDLLKADRDAKVAKAAETAKHFAEEVKSRKEELNAWEKSLLEIEELSLFSDVLDFSLLGGKFDAAKKLVATGVANATRQLTEKEAERDVNPEVGLHRRVVEHTKQVKAAKKSADDKAKAEAIDGLDKANDDVVAQAKLSGDWATWVEHLKGKLGQAKADAHKAKGDKPTRGEAHQALVAIAQKYLGNQGLQAAVEIPGVGFAYSKTFNNYVKEVCDLADPKTVVVKTDSRPRNQGQQQGQGQRRPRGSSYTPSQASQARNKAMEDFYGSKEKSAAGEEASAEDIAAFSKTDGADETPTAMEAAVRKALGQ